MAVDDAAQHDQLLVPLLRAETELELTKPTIDAQAVPGSDTPSKKAELGQASTSGAGEEAGAAAVTEEDTGHEVETFDSIVKERKPGQLRDRFISSLREREVKEEDFGDVCIAVRMAQVALGGNGKEAGVLQEGKVLGEGSFGVVKDARNSGLPGEYALKMLKEVRSWSRCAASEWGVANKIRSRYSFLPPTGLV